MLELTVAVILTVGFIGWQIIEYRRNKKALDALAGFFSKKEDYATVELPDNIEIWNIADKDSGLYGLIADINEYIGKSKGTVAFSIIQNKTERRISMMESAATSRLNIPTLIGLMGTFVGVGVGLGFFIYSSSNEGITDSSIRSLISGVIVAMMASFNGLLLLILSNRKASDAAKKADNAKNEFYEWVQNELMPSVDVSMVEAIGKLHETIDRFEPSFSSIISEFKDAFKDVTKIFGNEFRGSVEVVTNAVNEMGRNMNTLNRNVKLEQDILDLIRSKDLINSMNAFVEAAEQFKVVNRSLKAFERTRELMLTTAQETINIQRSYNESLQIPKQVAAEINMILNRINKFEENINGLGVNIAKTQLVGNALITQIKENISAINGKQKVAEKFAEAANEDLKKYFEQHKVQLGRIAQKYNDALDDCLKGYSELMDNSTKEMSARRKEFMDAIDRKLSIDDIKSDFSSLKKLAGIENKINVIAENVASGNELARKLDEIRKELSDISSKATDADNDRKPSLLRRIFV